MARQQCNELMAQLFDYYYYLDEHFAIISRYTEDSEWHEKLFIVPKPRSHNKCHVWYKFIAIDRLRLHSAQDRILFCYYTFWQLTICSMFTVRSTFLISYLIRCHLNTTVWGLDCGRPINTYICKYFWMCRANKYNNNVSILYLQRSSYC